MELGLIGKRALVTGSSVGISATIAAILAREGATVAVHGRDETRSGQVVDAIVASGGKAVAVLADLTYHAEVAAH